MDEEAIKHPVRVSKLIMPHMPDYRVCVELEYHIFALFAKKDVPCAHIREIKDDPHLFDIWHTLPHDMMTLMCHVSGV